jgi:hypothetical protein
MADHQWQPGDRVIVRLPDKSARRGRGGSISKVDVHGTVRAVDDDGGRRGVHVDLDREINGVRDCYATHAELRRPGGPGIGGRETTEENDEPAHRTQPV